MYDIKVDELTSTSPRCVQPSNVNLTLKDHQLALLWSCIQLENEKIVMSAHETMRAQIGIIADKVGSGKSFVLLALMATNHKICEEPMISSYGRNAFAVSVAPTSMDVGNATLLVITHNLVSQWHEYINQCCPQFKVLTIRQNKQTTHHSMRSLDEYDLIIVTHTFYNRFAMYVNSFKYQFRRVIFDEVDQITIPSCEKVHSCFTWFVTASYGNLLYPFGLNLMNEHTDRIVHYANGLPNLGFIKSLFVDLDSQRSVCGKYVKKLILKNNDDFVNTSFDVPNYIVHKVQSRSIIYIDLLLDIVDNEIIESLNAGDVMHAVSFINPNHKSTEENIIGMIVRKLEVQVRNFTNMKDMLHNHTFDNEHEQALELYTVTKNLDETMRKISTVTARIQDTTLCSICYEEMECKTIAPCCSNSYCFKCINMWLIKQRQTSCPMCKGNLKPNDLFVVDTPIDSTHIEDTSKILHARNTKITNLEVIMNDMTNRKFLILSLYDNTFGVVTLMLHKRGIQFASLYGNQYQIKKTVDQYKEGNIDVLFVNPEHYGCGLNLENTTDVVVYHRLNNEIEKQVIGRAQRLGRVAPLNVWYLLHQNELF